MIILHRLAARVKKPVAVGFFEMKTRTDRHGKQNVRFFYPHQRRLAGFGTGFTLE